MNGVPLTAGRGNRPEHVPEFYHSASYKQRMISHNLVLFGFCLNTAPGKLQRPIHSKSSHKVFNGGSGGEEASHYLEEPSGLQIITL